MLGTGTFSISFHRVTEEGSYLDLPLVNKIPLIEGEEVEQNNTIADNKVRTKILAVTPALPMAAHFFQVEEISAALLENTGIDTEGKINWVFGKEEKPALGETLTGEWRYKAYRDEAEWLEERDEKEKQEREREEQEAAERQREKEEEERKERQEETCKENNETESVKTAIIKPIYKNVIRYVGDAGTAWDILRRRRWTMESMRRLGTPVLIKHMYNINDVNECVATLSPNYDTVTDQPIANDPLSHGVGYVSIETTEEEWIKPKTERHRAELVIGAYEEGFEPAPTYRGYGPGYLTYVILPDAPVDQFKLTEEGALIRMQQARIQLPWNPQVADNDLLIVVELDGAERIIATRERYQLKKVNPITMRGRDRWGRQELGVNMVAGGNRFIVGQFCEASLVPPTDPIYNVEIDR